MKKGDDVYEVNDEGEVLYEKRYQVLEVRRALTGGHILAVELDNGMIFLRGEWVRAAPEPTEEDIPLAFDVWEKQGDCDPFSAFKAGFELWKSTR